DTCLNHRYALPNKLFEYIAASVPILASDLPEIRSVVRGYDLGLTVDPSNRESVAAALRKMTEHPDLRTAWRANAATAAETFNWESASHYFIDAMRSVIQSA
ncbi:MAG: glycosyltransferase, partial [Bacteroidetes bacterium]|nr:glycosyltransferase [Bacteroidota bacterium]